MKILKLINYPNLLLLAIAQLVFRYGFLEQQAGTPLALNHWQFALLVLASVLIAAGGSLMENISGGGKYHSAVSEATGYNIYGVLTLTGIGLGYFIADLIEKPEFVAAFVVAAAMLYIAAVNLRHTLIVSNVLVAITAALSIIIIAIFNFYPFLTPETREYLGTVFRVMLDYSLFAFLLVFIYTLVANLRDTDADYNAGTATLPIAIGRDRAVKVVFFLALLPLGLLFYYANTYLIDLVYALAFGLFLIAGPLIYFLIRIWGAKTSKEFAHLAVVLKLVMLFSIISIAVITYNMHNNA